MPLALDRNGSRRARGVSRTAIMVAAFWAIAVLPAATLPMTDPDTFWHIRAGLEVLDVGHVATTDQWSIVGAGRPWVSQDWLSNVAMAAGYRLGDVGPTVLSLAYGLMAAGAIAILWSAIGLRQPIGRLARIGWLLFGIVLAAPVLGVRVQVVDLLLASAVVWALWRYLGLRRPALLVSLPVIAVVWVNLHAGFPLLFLLGGAVLVGEALDRAMGRQPDGAPLEWRQLAWLFAALAAAAVALMLNPNGPRIYAYPFETLGITALSAFVGEWRSASLDTPAGQWLAAFTLLGVIPAIALGWRRMRSADALVMLGLTLMAAIAVRFVLGGPVAAAVVCVVLSPQLVATRSGAALARVVHRLHRRDAGRLGRLNGSLALAIVVVGLVLVGTRVAPAAQDAAVAERYPVEAIEWLRVAEPNRVIFNRYEWGGYLGLALPDRPVFIDGRADVYGDDLIREYVETISVTGNPQVTFDRYGVDQILYPEDSTLGRWLADSPAWKLAYDGDQGAIWTRTDG